MLRPLPLFTALLTLAFVVSPLFTAPFSGYRADQLPIPQVDPPVQPAGYAFAIWGLIYAWLIASALFGLLRRAADPAWDRVRRPLIVSLALGTPWLAIANASPVWATLVIAGMLAAAIAALLRTPATDRLWLRAPVAIYAGWLTAAAFVSLGATAAGYGVLLGPVGWALVCIAGAFAVAALVLMRMARLPDYGATVIWALTGIVLANGTERAAVSAAALAGILLLAALVLRGWRRGA